MIHPTAIIHPGAKLDPTVTVGPYAIIDEQVEVGAHCRIGPHVHLTGITLIGEHNRFHTGCVIGDEPQDLKYHGEPTRLRIGGHNVFREHVTVHRANKTAEDTVIGSHNFLMAGCHVGHNARLGDYVILANGALVAGHVSVDDRAFISGNCLLHQFVRVGTLALMQGGSAISKDLPPFTTARGNNGICGLNVIGLRRAGVPADERLELREVYQVVFRTKQGASTAIAVARMRFKSPAAVTLLDFVAASKRGVCSDSRARGAETEEDEQLPGRE